MHTVKGAWAGQTFAVASCNDSGGRKTRIRRSKEERKAMAETFIKTYQKSNNGNFPSVSLTHKEVGGSFYTVREIVREIIQENRVLGPAKFPPEEQNDDHPLFSLSIEPHSSLSSVDTIPAITDVAHSTIEENVLESNGQFHGFDKYQLDDEQVVDVRSDIIEQHDGQHDQPTIPSANEIIEDEQLLHYNVKSSEPDAEKLQDEKTVGSSDAIDKKDDNTGSDTLRNQLLHHQSDAEGNKISLSSGNSVEAGDESLCGEQIVDGSSLTVEKVEASQEPSYIESPVKESLGDKEGRTEKLKVSKAAVTRNIADVVVEKFPLRPISMTFDDFDGNLSESNGGQINKDGGSTSLGTRGEHDNMNSSKNSSHSMNKQVDAMLAGSEVMNTIVLESSLQTSASSTNEAAAATDYKVKNKSAETKTLKGNSNISCEKSAKEECLAINNRLTTQEVGSSRQKGNNPPLDRISLETWTSTKHEPNPLLAFFKALITAIVKILD